MKKIVRDTGLEIEIGSIALSTTDVVEIAKRFGSNVPVSAEIGNIWDAERWNFENLEDLINHEDLLATPLRLNIGDVNVILNWSGTTVRYKGSDEARARSIAEHLRDFRRNFQFLQRPWGPFVCALPFFLVGVFHPALSENVWAAPALLIIASLLLTIVSIKRTSSKIRRPSKHNFWHRNRDKIVVGFVIAAFTLILSKLNEIANLAVKWLQ